MARVSSAYLCSKKQPSPGTQQRPQAPQLAGQRESDSPSPHQSGSAVYLAQPRPSAPGQAGSSWQPRAWLRLTRRGGGARRGSHTAPSEARQTVGLQ